ncbi:MAG: formyltransferase family protein [Gemmatimonadota bacterium]|nr:formyltransferase family protein [Gemmatimonadota bacterium]
MPRVVLLSKPHPLTHHLEARLAEKGCLVGVVYEARLTTLPERLRYMQKLARRQGLLQTLDIAAYDLFERAFRRGELRSVVRRLLPALPAPDVPRHSVRSLNHESARQLIRDLDPDILVVHGAGILKRETFELARRVAINVHCGVLPEYRGHASTFWAIYRRDFENVGVTVHEIAQIVDTGSILRLGRVKWQPGETDITMWFRAFMLGTELVLDVVDELMNQDSITRIEVDGEPGPHYPRKGLTHYIKLKLGRGRSRSPRS